MVIMEILFFLFIGYVIFKVLGGSNSNTNNNSFSKNNYSQNPYKTNNTSSNSRSRFYIAGFHYYTGPNILHAMKVGDKLNLLREPNNKYDSNAIAIKTGDNIKLGHVPKYMNSKIANEIDKGIKFSARITKINPNASNKEKVQCEIIKDDQT